MQMNHRLSHFPKQELSPDIRQSNYRIYNKHESYTTESFAG